MLPRHHSESDASAPVRPIPFPRQQSLASPSPSASPSPEPLRSSTPPVGGAQGVGGSRGRTESSSNEVASQGHTPTKAAEPGRKRDLTGGGSIFSGTKFARKVKLSSFGTTSLSPRPSIDLSAAPPPTSPSASSLDVHTRKFSSDSLPGPMSKQAQMLGMGYTPDGATNGNGMGLAEDWYGWGDRVEVPHATMSPTSPRNLKGLEVIAPWDLTDDVVVTKAAESPVGSLRKGKEKVPAGRGSEGSVKEKKRGGFMSLLKRKTSKTDLNDGQSQESMTSYAEYRSPTPPPSFDRLALPAKLKARGDTADVPLPGPPKSSGGTFTKRPKNSKPLLSTPPAPLQKSVFTVDPAILLDTNFDSMEGIITKAAMDAVPPVQRSPVFDADRVDAERAAERNGSVATVLRTGPLNGSSIDGGRRFLTTRRTSSVSVVRGMLEADAPMFAQRTRESSSVSTSVGIGNGSGLGLSGAFWSEGGTPIRTTEPISPSDTRTPQDYPVDPASNGVLGPPLHLGADGANWTAPESWAVKPLSGMNAVPDSSDDESEHAVEDEEEDEGGEEGEGVDEIVPRALSGKEVAVLGTEPESPAAMIGRLAAQARAAPKHGRPGTADRAVQKNFMVRVFRPDSTFTTLPVPLAVTAAELLLSLGRKHQIHAKAGYALYLQEKGFERRLGPNEKPVLIQKRRFEQAGYADLDKLEDLGREDNSYICKLIYKPSHASVSAADDDIGDSYEIVNFEGRNIETIPIYLYRHAHEIVSLTLSKNRPFDLPADFVQSCFALRELTLSHMGIKRIPQAVKQCVGLTRLDLSNNHIVELDHIALDEIVELSSLKCHNNRLWSLPEYFSRFAGLKYLNLSNNRFDSVPRVLCDITALVDLDISFNTITTIPPEIGQLVNLDRLTLLANTITSLPPTLNQLSNLRELDCRRNNIADLSAISGVARLEVLRCEYNQASVLDASWSHMRILNASNNSVTRFALTGTSDTLTTLNLSFAKLSSLAIDMFAHLGSVETLIFDSNQIRVLPDGVGSLSNLVTLSIKNNILAELPASIGRLQRLQTLQVSGNNINKFPAEIWFCSQLHSIFASSNLLKEFPDVPLGGQPSRAEGSDELEPRKLSTASKPPNTASGRVVPPLALSLQRLYLGDNNLGDDVFAPISLMTELRHLNLSFNDIYEIPPSSLFKSQQLEELYLSGNKLTSLPPDDLERLVNLRLIYLNGNKLQTLPAELANVKRLHSLDVGSNVLKYNIANWPYDWNWNFNLELRYLNLSGNKRLEIKPGQQEMSLARGGTRSNMADFSALRKIRILGLMDVTLMIPSMPDETEDRRVRTSLSDINHMGYGIADTLGSRDDSLSLVDIVIPRFRSRDDEAIFGLFDAVTKGQQAGSKLVRYLQVNFTAVLTLELSRLKSGEVTSDALRRAFLGINRDYGNGLLPPLSVRRKDSAISLSDPSVVSARAGAAGIIVYIRKKRMYVANAGNALAVVSGRGGSARLVAKKHEPFDAAEISRIRTAEGWISTRGFVNDEVDVSRSFGFFNVFPAINVSPNIEEVDLADTDEFVIVANRGLWEYMSYQNAVDVARTERADPMAAAAKLRDLAISYGSSQNIMVMVLAVGDLYKVKKDYRIHRGLTNADDEGFYGVHKSGAALRRGKEEGAGDRYLNLLDREVAPPVGLVALVFTDIRNSTALWETNPGMQTAIRMHNQLLRRQLRAIGGYEVKTEGDAFMVSFPTVTSAFLWCLTVQLELLREDWPQEILDSEEGKEELNSKGQVLYRGLSVRMGIHWGAPVCEADPITRRMDYFGPMVNRSARISAVAEGGQVCASQDVIDLIREVVVEAAVERKSIEEDSGSGEDEQEEEEWLDANEKRDVLALRRLGFGISDLGERRLKGMETPETLSLLWPVALKDRIKVAGDDTDKAAVAEVHDPSSTLLDIALVQNLGRLCQRLEAIASALVHPHEPVPPPTMASETSVTLATKRKTVLPVALFPSILAYPLRPDATDDILTALLESYIIRIENCLSTLVLHQLGSVVEVLAALGSALKTDPRFIAMALSRYSAAMGL